MIPGINPRQMQQMMKRMGVSQVEIPAIEVIIRLADKELVITDPQVSKVNMMGQETLQVVGKIHEREKSLNVDINSEDIDTVAHQANVSKEKAKEALIRSKGDIAEAILSLSE